jgi:hypothetical protein
MPTINALTGSVRLLKADERIITQPIALVDCFVENFEEIFGADEPALTEALEQVREPLALVAKRVEAKLKPAAKPADQQGEQKKPAIAQTA